LPSLKTNYSISYFCSNNIKFNIWIYIIFYCYLINNLYFYFFN